MIDEPKPSTSTEPESTTPNSSTSTEPESTTPKPSTSAESETTTPVPPATTEAAAATPTPSTTAKSETATSSPSATTEADVAGSAPSATIFEVTASEPYVSNPNADNIIVDSSSGENAPGVSVGAETADRIKAEVIANQLTGEEKRLVANGAKLEILLSADISESTVSAGDRQAVKEITANTPYDIGQYLNIDLLKLIDGQYVGKITEMSAPISITVNVPEALKSDNRSYAIVRVHDGAAELLIDQDNDPDTITVLTDRFSTYAIVYQDTDANDKNPTTGSPADRSVYRCGSRHSCLQKAEINFPIIKSRRRATVGFLMWPLIQIISLCTF